LLELNKLYNMDCMEGMKQIPDKYFELAIVDYKVSNHSASRTISEKYRAFVSNGT
jgi:hypothetical protein